MIFESWTIQLLILSLRLRSTVGHRDSHGFMALVRTLQGPLAATSPPAAQPSLDPHVPHVRAKPTLTTAGLVHYLPSNSDTGANTETLVSTCWPAEMQLSALGTYLFFWGGGAEPLCAGSSNPTAPTVLPFHSLSPGTLASVILLFSSFFVPLGIGSHVGQTGLHLCGQGGL